MQRTQEGSSASFNLEEVSRHDKETDCWLVIDEKVYGVTDYLASHPGGKELLLKYCGQDASEGFNARPEGSGTSHSGQAREIKDGYFLSELEE